jgi:putative ABC transport system substrate-binding protein
VFIQVNDPVALGIVASLARPGGNVTGVSTLSGALSSKRVEVLREAFPSLARIAVLWNMANAGMALAFSQTLEAATSLGVSVLSHGIRTNEQVATALDDMLPERPDALIVLPSIDPSPITLIQDFTASHALPVIFSDRTGVDAGGLMGLGPNYAELHHRAAYYVDRILRGARPAELPVEQPSHFDFVVNLKTVRAMGLTIPDSVMLQATDVLQ